MATVTPIVISKNGKDTAVGSAHVEKIDGEYTVNFFLVPGFVLSEQVRKELTKGLIQNARRE